MSTTSSTSIGRKVWVGLRGALFLSVGFGVLLLSSVHLMGWLFDLQAGEELLSPLLSLPLTVVGAVLMACGAGESGRWPYFVAFLSIPLSLCLLFLLQESGRKNGWPVIGAYVAVFATFFGVRAYQARKRLR